ncbi:MAG: S-layer homology domain-containing protein, partial [Oscillospiraceae bacterium]|nr:S-layer homology domain-containing protein [Oscillospiraceae bacterium]
LTAVPQDTLAGGVTGAVYTCTSAEPFSDAGVYDIYSAVSGLDSNYILAGSGLGSYTVTPFANTFTAVYDTPAIGGANYREYGEENPTMGFAYTVAADSNDNLADFNLPTVLVRYDRTKQSGANADKDGVLLGGKAAYPVVMSGVTGTNYTVTSTDGVLNISQAPISLVLKDLTRPKDTAAPAPNDYVHFSGVYKLSDTLSALGLSAAYAPPPAMNTAGAYAVDLSISDPDNCNYYLTPAPGTRTLYVKNGSIDATITADQSRATAAVSADAGEQAWTLYYKNGGMVAGESGTVTYGADGKYTIIWNSAPLAAGTYTLVLNSTDPDGLALIPTEKDFTVGGGGGGGGVTPPPDKPELIKDDHFAYMRGSNGGFNPDGQLTRAEAAQVFYNLLVDKQVSYDASRFTDVDTGAWFARSIGVLSQLGIITGYSDGTFRPDAKITRAEFATLAARFDKLSERTVTFPDVPAGHWAYEVVCSAATKGWITGYSDGSFRPDNNMTRAEMVVMVNRVLGRDADKAYIDANVARLITFSDVPASHWAYYAIMEATNSHDYVIDAGKETWKN